MIRTRRIVELINVISHVLSQLLKLDPHLTREQILSPEEFKYKYWGILLRIFATRNRIQRSTGSMTFTLIVESFLSSLITRNRLYRLNTAILILLLLHNISAFLPNTRTGRKIDSFSLFPGIKRPPSFHIEFNSNGTRSYLLSKLMNSFSFLFRCLVCLLQNYSANALSTSCSYS